MKKLLSLSIATIMLANLSGEIFAQAYTIKGSQQGHSYFNNPQQKEQSDKLIQEMEKQRSAQEVAANLGVKYSDFKQEIEDYGEDNNIEIDEAQIKQLWNKYIQNLAKYDSDYRSLVNIFSKKNYKDVMSLAKQIYAKKAEEVIYNDKKYDRVAFLHAAIHDLIMRDTLGGKEKVLIMERVYDIVAKEGFYPQDKQRLWSFAYQMVKNGKEYFDGDILAKQKIEERRANGVAAAIALLPVLSDNTKKAVSAEAIHNLAKDIMRYDYGAIGISTAAQSLIALQTDDSLKRLETLLTEDLYRGLATRVSLYALNSLSFEEWENRGANSGNKRRGGLGQYHNAIARRFIYIDPKKNSKELLTKAQNKEKALEVLYTAVYTDVLEDIGKAIGKNTNNEKILKLADNLASKYVSDVSSKVKAREAKMHTSVIVGILATTKKRSANLTKAAGIIYNGDWWDISEATQRDKNNIAAKYLGYSQKKYDEGKFKEFKSLCYVKKVGHFVDIAILAVCIVDIVVHAPAIIRGVKAIASKGMNIIKGDVKALGQTAKAKPSTPKPSTAAEVKPADIPPAASDINAISQQTAIRSHINAGDLEFQLRNYKQAFIEYEKALAIDPKNPDALNKLAKAKEYAQGRINFYETALRKNPYDIDMHFEYADLKVRLGDLEGAMGVYGDILEIDPKNFRAFMDRAAIKYELGDYFGAISDVEKSLEINPAQRRPDFYEYAELKASDLTYYNDKIKHNPKDAQPYFERAKANIYLKNYTAALEDLNMAIKLYPKNAVYFLERAKLHYKMGNYAAAFKDVNTSIAHGTNNGEAFFFRGKLNAGYGNFQKAIDDFTMAISSFKDARAVKTEYIYERGYTYYLMENYSKALKDYNWVVSREKSYTILKERAEIKYHLGDYKGCVKDMEDALLLEPEGFVPKFYEEAKAKAPSVKVEGIYNENLNTSTWNWD